MKKILLVLTIVFLVIGCAVVPLGIEPVSEQLTDGQGNNKKYNIIGKVEDSDGYFSLFGFIPFDKISINDTFKKIARNKGGDALINIRYWLRNSFYVVGTYTSLEVKAEVIKYIQ